MKRHYRWASVCCAVLLLAALLCYRQLPAPTCPTPFVAPPLVQNLSNGGVAVDRSHGVVFVGGMPRSGTTLMRVMLDAHPALRCGEETRVIPRLLSMRTRWHNSMKERQRFKEAGLTDQVLDSAVAAFILEIITRHGEPASRLCNKDPFTMKSADYLSHLFPNARFIFMVRDARATVHSIISRNVTITNFDLSNYRQCFGRWNTAVQVMYEQCQQLGAAVCLQVPYEQLVLQPRRWMLRVLSFLRLPWHEDVLHHERTINKPGGASLSKLERSSDQVVRPLNLDGFHKWVGHIPQDVLRDLASLAPMMTVLGYDPDDPAPNYGAAESPVPSDQAAPPG